MKRNISWVKLILAVPSAVFLVWLTTYSIFVSDQISKIADFGDEFISVPKKEKITLLAVGDIMLDRGVEYMIDKQGKGDFKFPFTKIASQLKNTDILFGNLESVISDKGRKVGSVNSFRANPKAIDALKHVGFDIVSVANNHALDYTSAALQDSLSRLRNAGIEYVGAGKDEREAFSLKIINKKNSRIGFLAFTNIGPRGWRAGQGNPGIAWFENKDLDVVEKIISEAKKRVDILVVSLHWGEEYQSKPNKDQVNLAKRFIDAGADLIIGHHPHVVQLVERYESGWIAYSLGNFVFDQGFSKNTMKGIMINALIENKKIKKVNPVEIKISPYFQPAL